MDQSKIQLEKYLRYEIETNFIMNQSSNDCLKHGNIKDIQWK